MKSEAQTTVTNLSFEGMLKAQAAIDTLEPNSLLLPIYRLIYDLMWIDYQFALEWRKVPMTKKEAYRAYRRIKGYGPLRAFWRAYIKR